MKSKLRAVLYARVSTEAQADPEKVSIPDQLRLCREAAKSDGNLLVREFVDDKRYRVGKRLVEPSGTRTDRPGWRAMFEFVKAGEADIIYVLNDTRLYRAMRPAVEFGELVEQTNVQVRMINGAWDKRSHYFMAAAAKIIRDSIIETTEAGRRGRVRERKLISSGKQPFGYVPLQDERGKTTGYAFDPQWRELFDEMARLFVEGYSYEQIAAKLGKQPLTGKPWNLAVIARIFHNEFYFGRVTYGELRHTPGAFVVEGNHPPAWDPDTIAAILREVERRKLWWSALPRTNNGLFSGVLHCAYCGRPMVSRTTKGKWISYSCGLPDIQRRNHEERSHPANGINELKFINVFRTMLKDLTDNQLELLAERGLAHPRPNPDRQAWLQAQADQSEAKASELLQVLDIVTSPAARSAISAEAKRAEADLFKFKAELDRADTVGQVNTASAVEALKALRDGTGLWFDRAALRDTLRKIPPLYLKHGKIVEAPVYDVI